MTIALSLYLDALRFVAAFTVFVPHYGDARYSGGLLWQMQPYGHTAVLVLFVLSGFVIAWVIETREPTLEEYGLSRAALIGMAVNSRLYEPELLPQMSFIVWDRQDGRSTAAPRSFICWRHQP